jgi:hypothetical protein
MTDVTPATPWDALPEWLTVEQYRTYLQFKSLRVVELHIKSGKIDGGHVRGSGRGRRIHKASLLPGPTPEASGTEGGTVLAIPIRR